MDGVSGSSATSSVAPRAGSWHGSESRGQLIGVERLREVPGNLLIDRCNRAIALRRAGQQEQAWLRWADRLARNLQTRFIAMKSRAARDGFDANGCRLDSLPCGFQGRHVFRAEALMTHSARGEPRTSRSSKISTCDQAELPQASAVAQRSLGDTRAQLI